MISKLTNTSVARFGPRAKPYEVRDSECRGFLVRVEPTGRKAFWFQFSAAKLGGRRGQRIYLGDPDSRSVDSVRKDATVAKAKLAQGVDPRAHRKAERARSARERMSTLGTFLDDKFEPWARTHMKTHAQQLGRIRSDFKGHLDKPMASLHEVTIEGIRRRWLADGKQPQSVNRDIQRIGSVLSRAVEWGVIDRHPFKGMKQLKYDKTPRVRYLSGDEEAALRKALADREQRMRDERARMNMHLAERRKPPLPALAGDHLDHLRPMVLLGLNCGFRRGEMFGLQWGNVRLKEKWLTVVAATAKSGQTRRMPLNAEALAVLTAWRGRHPDAAGLVFPGAGGARMTNVNRSWGGVAKAAGLRGFHFHDLRHSFASKLVQNAVDLNVVRELLGHKDLKTTQMYAHLDPKNLVAAVEKVAQ